jgi:sugar transferase (PEP-CTERM system associated)
MDLSAVRPNVPLQNQTTIDDPERAEYPMPRGDGEPLGEDLFHQMIALECKRAGRSGNPSLLMRIQSRETVPAGESRDLMLRINDALASTLRETDVRGWYRESSVLGVVFTETGETDVRLARKLIEEKVRHELRRSLGDQEIGTLDLEIETFEQTAAPNGQACSPRVECRLPGAKSLEGETSHVVSSILRHRLVALLGDVGIVVAGFAFSNRLRFGDPLATFDRDPAWTVLSILAYPMAFYVFDLYSTWRAMGRTETVFRAFAAVLVGTVLSSLVFYLATEGIHGRKLIVAQLLSLWVLVPLWRLAYRRLALASGGKIPVLILGAGECGMTTYGLLSTAWSPYEVKGFLSDDPTKQGMKMNSPAVLGTLADLDEVVSRLGIQAVVLAARRKPSSRLARKILEIRLRGIEVWESPDICERLSGKVPVQHIGDQWLVSSEGFHMLSREYVQKIKRLMDILISGALLLFLLPVLSLAALSVVLESRGPVFYTQQRVGRGVRPLNVVNLRSMRVGAEVLGAQWGVRRDPRVTRVGRWIRLFRIDEIPQLWNVFKGDMSLIGPRPERPEFVEMLEGQIPYYSVRHVVRPGLTGWAQVNYPYGASLEDALHKLEYDLYYIKNMSLFLDLKILLRTIGVVLLGEGAR